MNTMKNFDITKLEYYYDNRISFKCIDIIKWCNYNLNSSDFDIKYAAEDLIKHYFSSSYRRPCNNYYYYIKYNEYGKNLYRLERDYIMSPFEREKTFSMLAIKEFENELNSIINKIQNSYKCTDWERNYIKFINDVYYNRLNCVMNGKEFKLSHSYKLNRTQRYQIYSITKDRLSDIQLLWFIFKKVTSKKR